MMINPAVIVGRLIKAFGISNNEPTREEIRLTAMIEGILRNGKFSLLFEKERQEELVAIDKEP